MCCDVARIIHCELQVRLRPNVNCGQLVIAFNLAAVCLAADRQRALVDKAVIPNDRHAFCVNPLVSHYTDRFEVRRVCFAHLCGNYCPVNALGSFRVCQFAA